MSEDADLIGQKFGRLTVIGQAEPYADGRTRLLCRCDCGNEKAIKSFNVTSGRSKSCGCGRGSNKHGLSGKRFGLLTVTGIAGRGAGGSVTWHCTCDCGGERVAVAARLVRGEVKDCGHRNGNTTHGQTGTPMHNRWKAMIQRCENPNNSHYADYGGRGIRVCREWRESFEAFARDMGPGFSPELELDRIDVNGNYEPGNVRWVPPIVNARNKRRSRYLTFRGRTLTVAEWAELLGLNESTIRHRLDKSGWPVERALTEGADPKALSALKESNR